FISHLIAKSVRKPVGKALANLSGHSFPNEASDGRPLLRRQRVHCASSVSKVFTKPLAQFVCKSVSHEGAGDSSLLGREGARSGAKSGARSSARSGCSHVCQPIRKSVGKALANLDRDPLPNQTASGGSLLGRQRLHGSSGI